MPTPPRLAQLVDEFTTTMYEHGIAVDRKVVEQEMRDRIGDIAERLRVPPQTVLLDHAQQGWGRQMAVLVIAQIQNDDLLEAGGSAERLPA
jgi:hypothetical protein